MNKLKILCYEFKIYYFIVAFKYFLCNHVFLKIPFSNIRKWYLKKIMKISIGKNTSISMGGFITGYHNQCNIKIGNNTVINRNVYIDGRTGVEIGNNVNISFDTSILSLQHDHNDPNFNVIGGKVIIHDNVWIGLKTVILPGVTLGEGCVIAAGAVVTKDVEPYSVVGGVPAKKISQRNKEINYLTSFKPFFDTDIANDANYYRILRKNNHIGGNHE